MSFMFGAPPRRAGGGLRLGTPVLVMRETTERKAVEMGTVRLVGTDTEAIVGGVSELLVNRPVYEAMSRAVNP